MISLAPPLPPSFIRHKLRLILVRAKTSRLNFRPMLGENTSLPVCATGFTVPPFEGTDQRLKGPALREAKTRRLPSEVHVTPAIQRPSLVIRFGVPPPEGIT